MKGDFSRLTFDRQKQFSRVFMQQGRVQLDADWNEQVDIFLDSLRILSADVIGPHAGTPDSFKITSDATHGFLIGKGHYYVHGIGCVNDEPRGYDKQKYYPLSDEDKKLKAGTYLVYLDVWERHVTAAEDDSVREVALGGAETTSRGQIVWQVKTLGLDGKEAYHVRTQKKELVCLERAESVWPHDPQRVEEKRKEFIEDAQVLLKKRVRKESHVKMRASVSAQDPKGQYRGVENQLYRVEIHKGTDGKQGGATFKWSRENGSVAFPIRKMNGLTVSLSYFGNDSRGGLSKDDWIEILDDRDVLGGHSGTLYQIEKIDPRGMDAIITLKANAGRQYGEKDPYHPVLRRWDQVSPNGKPKDEDMKNGLAVREGTWNKLEDGIEIQFCGQTNGQPAEYRSGDYWLIPARTETNDVEWPQTTDGNGKSFPVEQEPYGIDHYYAPLAFITADEDGYITVEHDCRYVIRPLGIPVGPPTKPTLALNVLALTFAGALLGMLWFVGEYLSKYIPIGTDGLSRLFVYICIGAGLGVVVSGLYNLFLRWFVPLWQSQKRSKTTTEVYS